MQKEGDSSKPARGEIQILEANGGHRYKAVLDKTELSTSCMLL